jgi:hypothetical protein
LSPPFWARLWRGSRMVMGCGDRLKERGGRNCAQQSEHGFSVYFPYEPDFPAAQMLKLVELLALPRGLEPLFSP